MQIRYSGPSPSMPPGGATLRSPEQAVERGEGGSQVRPAGVGGDGRSTAIMTFVRGVGWRCPALLPAYQAFHLGILGQRVRSETPAAVTFHRRCDRPITEILHTQRSECTPLAPTAMSAALPPVTALRWPAIWRLRSSLNVSLCDFFSARRFARSALTAALRARFSSALSPFLRATVTLGASVSVSEPESSSSSSCSSSWIAAAAAAALRAARSLASLDDRTRIMPGWFSVLVYVAVCQFPSE